MLDFEECLDHQEILGNQAGTVPQVHQENRERKENVALEVLMEQTGPKVHRVKWGQLVRPEYKVISVTLE